MGPLVVVSCAEPIEGALLGGEVARGGRQAPRFSVLCIRSWAPFCCGWAGQDPLMLNAQAEPPHIQRREPM